MGKRESNFQSLHFLENASLKTPISGEQQLGYLAIAFRCGNKLKPDYHKARLHDLIAIFENGQLGEIQSYQVSAPKICCSPKYTQVT